MVTYLILASASPRRRQLLTLLNMPFAVQPAAVDESAVAAPDPAARAVATASLKARSVGAAARDGALILGADTVVAAGLETLGKPAGPNEAVGMLRRLRGRAHMVYTGLALLDTASGRFTTELSQTKVVMRPYGDAEIDTYVATGDPLDKAGSYAIQHPIFRPAAAIRGCYTGVVGLPLCHLARALARLGKLDAGQPLAPATDTKDYRECATCLSMVPSGA